MTFKELFESDEFQEVFKDLEKFTYEKLDGYTKKLQETQLSNGSKEIFDAVWGNVEFSNGEIYILDSPLLQRLRGIKQLGLAYFVYCGCDYSRFYHTIGVTYLADRMAIAINRCDLGIDNVEKDYFKEVVRLAAIFHDIGHMFLSHVSEHYFAKSSFYPQHDKVDNILMAVAKKTKKDDIALHELLGCMMVNTSAVRKLLECVKDCFDVKLISNKHDLDDLIEYISCLILGVPVDRDILPYSNIINGPVDADKCDYLSRDSHVTNVPVAVDISRLTQKLSVVEKKNPVFSDVWHNSSSDGRPYYILAMKDSAEKALFQMCIARTIMFDSVYYHHKVLTAESEFRNIINRLSNLNKPLFTSFYEILNYMDDDFNVYFCDSIRRERGDEDCKAIDRIHEDLKDLYERRLAKRVVCLMPDYIDGPQGKNENLFDDVLNRIDSQEGKELIDSIKKEYIDLQKKINKQTVTEENLNLFIIHTPTVVFGHPKIQVPIDLQNGNSRDFKGHNLVSSRETSSSASYIVSNAKDKDLILISLKKILAQKYGTGIKKEGLACGKYNQKSLIKIETKLFGQGYYDTIPQIISDDLLFNYIPEDRILELKEKYSAYEGPDGYRITEEEIKKFLKQILGGCRKNGDIRNILEGIFSMLEHALIMNRRYLSEKIDSLFKELGDLTQKKYIVPLGSLKDSAKHMMYYLNDRKSKFDLETEKSLKEILDISEVDQIIFFDDGSFSGTQLISIMQEYLGVAKKTDEHHVDELPDVMKTRFREKKLIFMFIAFNHSNEESLRRELEELGFANIQFVFIEDMSDGWLNNNERNIFDSDKQREAVKNFLNEVGYAVLKSCKTVDGKLKKGWSEDRLQKSALGYNDAQQMVFLKSSVPTYTITAFWQSGEFNGMYWEALFKRTTK